MSIFGSIMSKIFKRDDKPQAPTATTTAIPTSGPAATATTTVAPAVDVAAVLEAMALDNGQELNWRSSIVDLLKLLSIDSSLANRKELAGELGYTGDKDDSATMNVWLHKAVMQKLAQNGGIVPDALR